MLLLLSLLRLRSFSLSLFLNGCEDRVEGCGGVHSCAAAAGGVARLDDVSSPLEPLRRLRLGFMAMTLDLTPLFAHRKLWPSSCPVVSAVWEYVSFAGPRFMAVSCSKAVPAFCVLVEKRDMSMMMMMMLMNQECLLQRRVLRMMYRSSK